MREYFTARLPIEYCDDIHKEFLEGRMRFPYGAAGLDLRNGKEEFIAAFLKHFKDTTADNAQRYYWLLSVLMRIHKGDIILLPKVSINRPERGNYFTVVECTEDYSFAPLPNNDFGHIIGVKILGTFDYRDVNSKITLMFRFRAINKINNPETIQSIEKLLCSLLPHENDLDAMKEKMLSMEENYLEGLLEVLKVLPPDSPLRKAHLQKIFETVRIFSPDTLKKIVIELFTKNGHRLLGDEHLMFEIFSEREVMHAFYNVDNPQRIFVCVKSFGISYEEIFSKFEASGNHDMRLLIDLVEKFDEDTLTTAEALGVILIDGLTFANALARYKV